MRSKIKEEAVWLSYERGKKSCQKWAIFLCLPTTYSAGHTQLLAEQAKHWSWVKSRILQETDVGLP